MSKEPDLNHSPPESRGFTTGCDNGLIATLVLLAFFAFIAVVAFTRGACNS